MMDSWKKKLVLFLKKRGLIDDQFTGKVAIEFKKGTINSIVKSQKIK